MTPLVPPVCRIIADTFEGVSGVPDELRALGVQIEMVTLTAGDYDLGSGVRVERKTVADLHLSLERGRLWDRSSRNRSKAGRGAACSDLLTTLAVRREWLCPAARSVVEIGITGGTCVACSDRAVPRHLRGSP